jgi:hypothetical protein
MSKRIGRVASQSRILRGRDRPTFCGWLTGRSSVQRDPSQNDISIRLHSATRLTQRSPVALRTSLTTGVLFRGFGQPYDQGRRGVHGPKVRPPSTSRCQKRAKGPMDASPGDPNGPGPRCRWCLCAPVLAIWYPENGRRADAPYDSSLIPRLSAASHGTSSEAPFVGLTKARGPAGCLRNVMGTDPLRRSNRAARVG